MNSLKNVWGAGAIFTGLTVLQAANGMLWKAAAIALLVGGGAMFIVPAIWARFRSSLRRRIRHELADIYDEGTKPFDQFSGVQWSRYMKWKQPAAQFIETVLGKPARQFFERDEKHDPPANEKQNLENRVAQLQKLQDRESEWTIEVNDKELREAIKQRHVPPETFDDQIREEARRRLPVRKKKPAPAPAPPTPTGAGFMEYRRGKKRERALDEIVEEREAEKRGARGQALQEAFTRKQAPTALEAIFQEGDTIHKGGDAIPAAREENDIRAWNGKALAAVKKYAPQYLPHYDAPITLGHSAQDMMRRAMEVNSATDLPELKRKLHERLRRLDQIIRELRKDKP
jgi:hypothetical protein